MGKCGSLNSNNKKSQSPICFPAKAVNDYEPDQDIGQKTCNT